MRALRKLVLGETVALPVGVAVVLGVALALHEDPGGRQRRLVREGLRPTVNDGW